MDLNKFRKNRAPSFGVDDGVPFTGRRYGGADTIHNTGTIDIVMRHGVVSEVWFRCQELSFQVSSRTDPGLRYGGNHGARLVAVEVVDE